MTVTNQLRPNFTQIPNIIFDELLPMLEKGELKVLLYVMRRTYGFQKMKDRISFSQLQHGIKDREGNQIDKGTGIGRETLTRAIANLEEIGILVVDRESMTNTYSLNLNFATSTTIELVPQSNKGSTIIEPKLVPQSNTQKKVKESIQKKEESSLSFLQNIPEKVIEEFVEKFKVEKANIITKGNSLYDWCETNGKRKKNYKSFLGNALRKDFGERPPKTEKKQYEIVNGMARLIN